MQIKCACALLRGIGVATLAGTLLVSVPASAHTLGTDVDFDLGKTTDWDRTGRTRTAQIPDVEGEGENSFRFEIEQPGPVKVWTSGNIAPDIAIFDGHNKLSVWSSSALEVNIRSAGTYFIRARSHSSGAYRLHVAGGGKGHDDVGNVIAEATPMQLNTNKTLEIVARIDHPGDKDWFTFEVPAGGVPVLIWSSGATDTWAALYDEYGIALERNNDDGFSSNFNLGRMALDPGTYYVEVRGGGDTVVGPYRLHLGGKDDHSNFFQTASRVHLPTNAVGVLGEIDYLDDEDVFWFQVSTRGSVKIWLSGDTETSVTLYDENEVELDDGIFNPRSRSDFSFAIDRTLDPGIYYMEVRHLSWNGDSGSYYLHLSGEASGIITVPLLSADGHARGQQGFVRVINHSDHPAEVAITAVDDTGMRRKLSPLNLAARQTVHFNSQDLEKGNDAKGIKGGIGSGTGNWYLEVAPNRPEVEVLSYIRTRDGFLTSMHAQAPNYGRTHRVATFNPGSNRNQASRLRLINLKCPSLRGCEAANVTLYGVDDDGVRSPDVRLQVPPGGVREVTAAQLEGLEQNADGLAGSLGDGEGKWQLFITADRHIQVISLLESVSGHLTNLSAPMSRQVFSTPERQE